MDEFGRLISLWSVHDSLSRARQQRVQAAPRAIADWIDHFAPNLKDQPTLDIVVVASAENLEIEDGGVWYHLIPKFLERIMTVNVTILPALESLGWMRLGRKTRYSRTRSPREISAIGARAAEFVQASLPEFLERNPEKPIDLVVLMDAELDDLNRRLLGTGGIEAALARGACIAVGSNELQSYEKQQWLLGQYGYGVSAPVCEVGTLRLEHLCLPDYEVRWSDVLWKIESAPFDGPWPHDPAAMKRLDNFELYLLAAEKGLGKRVHRAYLGQPNFALEYDDGEHILVGLPSGILVDMVDGALMYADENEGVDDLENAAGFTVPAHVRAQYPDESAPAFERALWSAETARLIDKVLRAATDPEPHFVHDGDTPDEVFDALRPVQNVTSSDSAGPFALGRPTPGGEALFRALSKGQWGAAINMILEDPHLVNAVNEYGETPAFLIRHKDRTDYQKLKRLGANLSHKDNLGFSLIHRIAQAGSRDAALFCLMSGVDVNLTGPDGWTPALLALANGNFEVLEILLLQGADVSKRTELGYSLRDLGEGLNMPDRLKDLLRHRATPN